MGADPIDCDSDVDVLVGINADDDLTGLVLLMSKALRVRPDDVIERTGLDGTGFPLKLYQSHPAGPSGDLENDRSTQ